MRSGISGLIALIVIHASSTAQLPVPVDSLYTFIKYNSVWRHTLNWDSTDLAFRSSLQAASSTDDTLRSLVKVLRGLNDVHSQLFFNNRFYGHYPDMEDTLLQRLTPLVQKGNALVNQPQAQLLKGEVLWLQLPGMQVKNGEEIRELAGQLKQILKQKPITGCVIDLRLNGGGNLYPMMGGLAGLLGEGTVGYELDADHTVQRTWSVRGGDFFINEYNCTGLGAGADSILASLPVVLITGPATRSSGSMVAIAFRGRPRTLLLGTSTASGYTTSNNFYSFAPNLSMNFSVSWVADRNKKSYPDAVEPDLQIFAPDLFDHPYQDAKIRAALEWISRQ